MEAMQNRDNGKNEPRWTREVEHSVEKKKGEVLVWGWNCTSQLGLGDTTDRNSPTLLHTLGGIPFTMVACGLTHTVAININGHCYAWGNNQHGQLGIENTPKCTTPTPVATPDGIPFDFICCGGYHTIAINKENFCYVWGRNDFGQLGLGRITNCSAPTLLSPPLGIPFRKIACGGQHTIAINQEGECYTWGYNYYGALGLGDCRDRQVPTLLPLPGGIPFEIIACGWYHNVAINQRQECYVWGDNAYGELGLGHTKQQLTPILLVPPECIPFTTVECGCYNTIAINQAGKCFVWGRNDEGQLGLGDNQSRCVPTALSLNGNIPFAAIYCGSYHTIGITSIQKCYVWGQNRYGELGLGDTTNRNTPIMLPLPHLVPEKIPYIENLLDDESFSDITIGGIIPAKERRAHRCLLQAHAAGMLEYLENHNNSFSPEIPLKVLEFVLTYVYKNEIDQILGAKETAIAWYWSNKFSMKHLEWHLLVELQKMVNQDVQQWVEIFVVAEEYNITTLMELCFCSILLHKISTDNKLLLELNSSSLSALVAASTEKKVKEFNCGKCPDQDYSGNMLQLLENGVKSDCIVEVDGYAFPAHKAILSCCSPYFKAALGRVWDRPVKLTYDQVPISKQAFKQLLTMIYTGRVPQLSAIEGLEILQTAGMGKCHCLMIPDYFGLSDQCAELLEYLVSYVSTSLEVSNCLGVLTFAHKFGHKELMNTCLEFIVANHSEVISQKEWNEMEDELKSKVSQLLHEPGKKKKFSFGWLRSSLLSRS